MPKFNIKIDFKVYETKLNSLKIKNINYKKQETLFF